MNTPLGVNYDGAGRCHFRVWAPYAEKVKLALVSPQMQTFELQKDAQGYHSATVEVAPPARYYYVLDEKKQRPDPASRFQPLGVHGPSEVVDANFAWNDVGWRGLPLEDYVIYELHVGTFTPAGTFDAAGEFLDELKALGVTAVELMPVAQFPGTRNWGYDGTYPYATQNSYGGPLGLKRFVNACHARGMAVVLDVVYNHLGPEGNYLGDFGPYFTGRYHTPWGQAINYDDAGSDEVRHFFIENALYWVTEFHVDALRLDAIHAIFDQSAFAFLEELGAAVHTRAAELGRKILVIPESDLNNPRMITARELGGFGLDAQWSDDLHHALHTLLTRETSGYYEDFGSVSQLAKALRQGFVYTGQYSPYRRRRHGRIPEHAQPKQFVVFAQNHDQVGNRLLGDRLSQLVSFPALKLAAGVVLLAPGTPLLFMGEEYGETAPFQYFVSHTDADLIAATRKGRAEEFASFGWRGEIPDPQSEDTFLKSKLNRQLKCRPENQALEAFYRELIALRQRPVFRCTPKENIVVRTREAEQVVMLEIWDGEERVCAVFALAEADTGLEVPLLPGRWRKLLDSEDVRWGGQGSRVPETVDSDGEVRLLLGPRSLVLLARAER